MANISVVVVNEKLDRGLQANAVFVLGLTMGRLMGDATFGKDVVDGDGRQHSFLTCIGHTVRMASPTKVATLRNQLAEHPEVILVDYTEDAGPPVYELYELALKSHAGDAIIYRAFAAYGPEEVVYGRTKNLSLLRDSSK